MKPTISIVTISYNQAPYLRQCLDSVLMQKGPHIEYIVVDPGSTDGSRDIIRSYSKSIDHLVFEPDSGPADGLNKGFGFAKHEYGYFLNSDDFLLPSAMEALCEFWDENQFAQVGLCGAWLVNGRGRPVRPLKASRVSPSSLLDNRAIPVQQGLSFRMDAFRGVGGFNRENRSCWDLELLYEFTLANAKFALGADRIAAFRLYGESLSGGVAGATHQRLLSEDRARMVEKLPENESLKSPAIARCIKFAQNPSLILDPILARVAPFVFNRSYDRELQRTTPSNDK